MFELKRVSLYICISPRHSSNILKGVHVYLSKLVMRYIPELSGVLISYASITCPPSATLIGDNPNLYLTITADFTLFSPKVGQILLGHVNKVSSGHVGVLVHGLFNGSVAASEMRRGEVYVESEQAWGEVVNGSYVRFRVERLAVNDSTLTLQGSLKGQLLGSVSVC